MLNFYQWLMNSAEPLLSNLLDKRVKAGKEDHTRLNERKGITGKPRPSGSVYWVHAASIGEAQSALTLIHALLNSAPELHILVTTGTLTSAKLMEKNLPPRAFHQFYPLDHPNWTKRFLQHWQPDLILWMESELWPNMLRHISEQKIPAALINARLSSASYKKWRLARPVIKKLLSSFSMILCQTHSDEKLFKNLGANNTHVSDNLKYSAAPLAIDDAALSNFTTALQGRPCWVYASTHQGEETLAAQTHEILQDKFPDLLSIIIPRHPNRRDEIMTDLSTYHLKTCLRGEGAALPSADTDIYIADTLGELGLFYRASPIAVIGRSFSADGGGGHNPIEAAQLGCAILHGPHVQNLQAIFDEMNRADASTALNHKKDLATEIQKLLENPKLLSEKQGRATEFAQSKARVLPRVLNHLSPLLQEDAQNAAKNP